MKRNLLFKGIALASTLLLGGAYVYDRAGGNLLPDWRPKPAPSSAAPTEASADASAIHFYGSKSAPVFGEPIPLASPTEQPQLFSGSKSLILVPPTGGASTAEPTVKELPAQQSGNEAPQILPGSKSAAVFTPTSPSPAQQP